MCYRLKEIKTQGENVGGDVSNQLTIKTALTEKYMIEYSYRSSKVHLTEPKMVG